ncbi:Mrs2p KNAG_0E00480 [Huiozyma naganishii CBS 8797]|uniref:Magnesium transporter n=1 Tax=Huiozyma naganishii (strain ATCC MYA-139 / BCRC 22969 / CBS 8797 / KCTC 17520 / NBRC 10181 / NCYC 3082 / Yp74L-3) TaxID=1071383 RepID=J7S7G0_HUIN7|nr:hypothetical protein KNAG_0E00480 [Kazachstania naganishii CBS 8797]CCK70316.1 hypothetical protein KNAG_0E00480 [Kazachstania naganishii CBS 8797]
MWSHCSRRCSGLLRERVRVRLRRGLAGLPSLKPIQQQLLSLQPIKPTDSQVSCSVFNAVGHVVAVSQKFPKWQFLREHSLYPRDLRKLDSSNVEVIPTIMTKRNCIVVNLLHIKALIEQDRVFVFDTADRNSALLLGVLIYDLESKLRPPPQQMQQQPAPAPAQPYEHRALECILINVMSTLETEFKKQASVCKQILFQLENEVNRDKLRDLLVKSKSLTAFYQRAFLIREVLDELLESDEDLAAMYLAPTRREGDDFAELEMLIENYYTQCDEFVQQAMSLIEDIKSTEEIVNIILDANRNSLMLLELKVTIYTLGVTVATLLPAFYGMNLKNFIEESVVGFNAVVVLSLAAGLWITRTNFKSLRDVTKLSMLKRRPDTAVRSIKRTSQGPPVVVPQPTLPQKFSAALRRIWRGPQSTRKPSSGSERDYIWKWLMDDKK